MRASKPTFASTPRVLRRHLDVYTDRVRSIELRALACRGHEIARLLAVLWRDELGSDRSVAALGPASLRGLAVHGWDGNFAALRVAAVRVLAYAEHRTVRAAARALGVRHQSLCSYLHRIGVEVIDCRQIDREPAAPTRSQREAP